MTQWLKIAWEWLTGWITRRENLRDSDDARMRLNMDFVLSKYQDRVTDQANRITALEQEQKSMAQEMMRVKIEHAKCEVRTTNMELEIERLKAALEAKA